MKGIDTIRRGMVQWLSLRLTVYEDFCGSLYIVMVLFFMKLH